jgi:hypothetical protein
MQIPRQRFVEHLWPKRRTAEPPWHLAGCLHRWLRLANGRTAIDEVSFVAIAMPVIAALHRVTPAGTKPDPAALAGQLYDALSAAGIEVVIGPPAEAPHTSHGSRLPP